MSVSPSKLITRLLQIVAVTLLAITAAVVNPTSAQAAPLALCLDGHDEYHFSPGLDAFGTEHNRFNGRTAANARSTCPIVPTGAEGAREVKLAKTEGQGELSCVVNARVTGQITLQWIKSETTVVATSQGDLISLAIDGASKVIVLKAQMTSGPGSPGLLTITYTATSDTRYCLDENGLTFVDGLVTELSIVAT